MKHRQVGINKVGVVNADGHAIGLDIGATAVRASVLAQGMLEGRPSVTVQSIGRVDLAEGVVVNGVVHEPAALTSALKRLWAENKFEGRNVILGIANQQVLVRDMSVPDLDPARQRKALPFQAREIVALPIEQVILDFCRLGEPDPETNTVHGLLVATPREPVLALVNAVERAGLKVARVDLSSFGSLRAIADEDLAIEAIVDIGAHLTTIVVHNHGVPKLVRTLPRGGAAITEQLSDRLSVPPHEAEAIKCMTGLEDSRDEVTRALDRRAPPAHCRDPDVDRLLPVDERGRADRAHLADRRRRAHAGAGPFCQRPDRHPRPAGRPAPAHPQPARVAPHA